MHSDLLQEGGLLLGSSVLLPVEESPPAKPDTFSCNFCFDVAEIGP